MQIGLQIPDLTWPEGPAGMARTLADISRTAEDAGFSHVALMDHFFQIPHVGPIDREMLEAYTALGFMAAHTSRVKLLTLVTGAVYRYPGVLAKTVSTLDVLSGGRAWLGIGAAWMEDEARGLGIPFPPLAERFERLEEAVQIALQMWSDNDGPYHGKHYQLERTLDSPRPLSTPHPPIMIGGSGEKKTLRLVAKYAQACNLIPSPAIARKLEVLRQHCEDVGRDYDEIEKTAFVPFHVGDKPMEPEKIIDFLGRLGALGIQTVFCSVTDIWQLKPLELVGDKIIPAVAEL
ncbi:LLM class F420-dependent oxidoreductase [Streptomyces litchfieldiae]|uniref:LLM class F420-dependent oxidoreductase n=1 Tax=Streptomyces litchfieldiae TaxID=3075543 RepID=A0ABU2N0A3_9ACTN|nr:LLM class F420-dependent oxidoreductase [Streptomyces sp. DSM 44938]MDT0347332.1 LLM class F420-dependent oxidoreductase [Streptomyces sp. DSM 44938]